MQCLMKTWFLIVRNSYHGPCWVTRALIRTRIHLFFCNHEQEFTENYTREL